MLGFEGKAARYTWTAAMVALLLCCVYLIRKSLIVFAVSLLLTYLLYPLYTSLNRILPGRSRAPALLIVYLTLLGVATLIVLTVGTQVVTQANALAARAPDFLKHAQNETDISTLPQPAKTLQSQVLNQLRSQLVQHSGQLMAYIPQYSMKVLSWASYLLLGIVVPIISFFMLKDGSNLREDLIDIVAPGRNRDLVKDVLSDVHVLLLQYMRALFTLCISVFGSFAIIFWLMDVPYGLLLATIAFPLEFIPLVGPMTAAVVIMIVVLFSGYAHPLWVLAFLGIYRIFQDYVLSPNLMAAGMELHPLMVIFGVLAGGEIGGVAGIFLSVPVLALVRIIFRRIRRQRVAEPEHVVVT